MAYRPTSRPETVPLRRERREPLRRERYVRPDDDGGWPPVPPDSPRHHGYDRPPHRRKRYVDYPRSGRRGVRRYLPSWRQSLACLLLFVAVCVGGFFLAYALMPIPDENQVATSQASILTYANGKPLGRLAAQNREDVPISKVPKHVREAVLAAEDRGFYDEPGFSVTGIFRAAWAYVRGEELQGGSTITQQYVKKTYLTDERTWSRKAKELVLAIKLERQLSKNEILQHYLNTVYFGRGAYGVQTAAQAYFGKDVSQLSPAEGAVLASLIRSPALYDPEDHPANLHARFHYVINGMAGQGWLTPQQAAGIKFPHITSGHTENQYKGEGGYLIQMVKDELERRGITEDMLLTGGYRVETTFRPKLMRYAKQAVREAYPDVFKERDVALGMAAVQPGTGRIVAIYGGKNYLKQQINHATTGGLTQPGSSFKPYVLATALQEGIGLKTTYDGHSPQTIAGHEFHNAGGEQFGWIDLPTATEHSVNTVFVQLGQDVGLDKVIRNAHALGIQNSPWCPLGKGNTRMKDISSLPLGPMDVCPLEQAAGYATFVNGGSYVEPTTIVKVTDASGKRVIYRSHPDPRKVFSKGVSADTLYAMQKVVEGGTGTAAQLPDGRPVAGKTGTSSYNRSAWWVGTVPQLTAAVAMFRADGSQIPRVGGYNTVYGGTIPAQVWEAFMAKATDGMKVKDFPDPAWVGKPRHVHSTVPPVTEVPTTQAPEPTQETQEPSTSPPSPSPTPSETTTEPTESSTPTVSPTPSETQTGPRDCLPFETCKPSHTGPSPGDTSSAPARESPGG